MPDKKLEKLKQLLDLVNNQLDPEELKKIFAVMTQMKQGIEADTQALKEAIAQVSQIMQSRLETTLSDSDKRMNETAMKKITELMNPMMAAHEEMMAECDEKMSEMEGMILGNNAMLEKMMDEKIAAIPEIEPQEKEVINMSDVVGLDETIKDLKQRSSAFVGSANASGGSGGGKIVKYYDLSSSLNGVLKTFSLPSFWRIIDVKLSSVPVLRLTTDYTVDGTLRQITFTSAIDASTQLSSGQSCWIIYSE